jgi:prenyltransferase beta subunit
VWQLALLGELAVPADDRIKAEAGRFLDLHQAESGSFVCPSKFETGKRWDEPCLTGNMIRTLIKLGYSSDKRVRKAVDWLPKGQLEDGGWNCDYPEKKVKHSSFMSTIEPLWAYSEIPRQQWTRKMKRSVDEAAEFLLMHHVYKSDNHHWQETYPFFTKLHFPMYYLYDILHALRVLTKLGYGDDERIRSAVQLLLSKRRPDGRWNLEGDWYREGDYFYPSGKGRKAPVAIEEIGKPSKWITLNAYRVLTKTGDLDLNQDS